MKNILKKIILSFLIIPIIGASLAVVACKNKLVDITNDLDDLNLGYVSDLKSSTILATFSEKNPKIKMNYINPWVTGDSHKGIIYTNAPHFYYQPAEITVNYYSKLDFDENNEKNYEITSKDDKCLVSFRILDDSYNENIDEKITWSEYIGDYLYQWIKFDYEINKDEKFYKVIISLQEDINESLQKSASIIFRWGERDSMGVMSKISLATLNFKIKI